MDFDALVLAPAMNAFAQPAVVSPLVSQPGVAPYPGRGSWSWKAVQIPLEDGTYHSTNQPALGVRLSEFVVAPMQGDKVTMTQGIFEIADVVPDGQGGADIMLRKIGA